MLVFNASQGFVHRILLQIPIYQLHLLKDLIKMIKNTFLVGITLLSLSLLSSHAYADKDPLPNGYSNYLTYIANGSYAAASPHPVVPGCFGGFCDGHYFQTEIMGRDQGTIDALTDQAALFYLTRFGIDVHAPENSGRITFRPFMLDPRLEYRAYVVSGMKAPKEGWVVRDGGWIMIINDPAGYELGGDFTGVTAPAGSFFFYGEYNIDTGNRHKKDNDKHHKKGINNKKHNGNIVISYRAGSPAITNAVGLLPFSCEVALQPITKNFSNGTEGLAQGIAKALIPDSNGFLNANVRNTLTFNAQGGR